MKLKKRMAPKWSNIHKVQDKLEKKLKNYDKGFIDSAKMVVGELLENSVKYYMEHGIKSAIILKIKVEDQITISILNQKIFDEDIYPISQAIIRINKSDNPYNLFIDRLQEILDNRRIGESRLGLLRIASEGGFALSYQTNNNDKISIFATKMINREGVIMEPLNYEDLTIEIESLENYVKVSWIGRCRTLNPEQVLDSYLARLTHSVRGKKVVVIFDKLDSMNSSTVPPLLTFIKTLEDDGTEAVFLYDDKEDWQRASFRPLSVIAGKYKHITIKPITNYELV